MGFTEKVISLAHLSTLGSSPSHVLQTSSKKQLPQEDDIHCWKHPFEAVLYYCLECETGLCPQCVVSHSQHRFVFADREASSLVEKRVESDLGRCLAQIERLTQRREKSQNKLHELSQKKSEQLTRIESWFDEIQTVLKARRDALRE